MFFFFFFVTESKRASNLGNTRMAVRIQKHTRQGKDNRKTNIGRGAVVHAAQGPRPRG